MAAPSPSASVSPALSETEFTVPSAIVKTRRESLCLNTMAAHAWLSRVVMLAPFKTMRTVPSTFFATSTAPERVPESTYVPAALMVKTLSLKAVPVGALSFVRVVKSMLTALSSVTESICCSSETATLSSAK